jgi:hypothetical protein
MKKAFLLLTALLTMTVQIQAAGYYGVTDPAMGEYEGFWTAANGARGRITAQVRPVSNNRYDGFILIFRGRSPVTSLTLQPAPFENDRVNFTAATASRETGGDLLAQTEATGSLENGKLIGTFKGELGEGKFEAAKSARRSNTLGAKPPAKAIVLFDEKPSEVWENFIWPVVDGAMQVGKGNVKTTQKLSDFRLHLEFRTPYMPTAQGQARGNSGVYLQGKYEVQVLDSFGLFPLKDNDCAGIYRVQAPAMNASLPPMEWQTYDITFRSAGPTITISHNGTIVVNEAKVPAELVQNGTGGGDPNAGFLLLQDHGNPVQFRNIWAEPLTR